MSSSPHKNLENLHPLLDQLNSDDAQLRVQAADKIGQMGSRPSLNVQELWDAFDRESEDQVRIRILRAIFSVTTDDDDLETELKARIKGGDAVNRIAALDALAGIGSDARLIVPILVELLRDNREIPIQQSLSRALLAIETDKTFLINAIEQLLSEPVLYLYPLFDEVARSNPSESDRETLLTDLWRSAEANVDPTSVGDLLGSILRLSRNPEQFFDQLKNNKQITEAKKGLIFYIPYFFENSQFVIKRWWDNHTELVLNWALAGLKDQFASTPTSWFFNFIGQSIEEKEKERILPALEESLKTYGVGLEALATIGGSDRVIQVIIKSTGSFDVIGRYLLSAPSILEDLWQKDQESVIRCLLPLLRNEQGVEVPAVAEWFRDKAEHIPNNSYAAVIRALQPTETDSPETRTKKEAALIQIRQYERKILQKPLFEVLDKGADIDSQSEAVNKLVQLQSREVTRDLVNRWVQWLAFGDKPVLTETTAEYLRMSTQAVLPLVDHVSKKLELNPALKKAIFKTEIPPTYFYLIEEVYPEMSETTAQPTNPIDPESRKTEARRLLGLFEDRSPAFTNLISQSAEWDWRTIVEKTFEQLTQEEIPKRDERTRQRIVKQLADMSDRRFFDTEAEHEKMKNELGKHAIPVMAARLPKEADINVRENSARLLGNVSGREAIDALVLAVVGEERTRAARQELLATYYLDPSKQRSEEAAQILAHAVADARQTLSVLRWLNIIVFVVGILLLVSGTATALYKQEVAARVVGALAGLGGLAGILVEMVKSPLDRIQNAMANLVQIETAFTSFIWELNLNGTFIQSQYVKEGVLTDDEIARTVERIEDAMTLAMNQVSIYTKVGQQRVVSRIYDLSPAAGVAGSMVTVHGQHLTGDKTEKKEETGILAINHNPIKAEKLQWKDHQVSFKLPDRFNGAGKFEGTVWLSLLVDGMETNALPFHVIGDGEYEPRI